MKKFITAVFAAVLALGLQIPCLAADLSPATRRCDRVCDYRAGGCRRRDNRHADLY